MIPAAYAPLVAEVLALTRGPGVKLKALVPRVRVAKGRGGALPDEGQVDRLGSLRFQLPRSRFLSSVEPMSPLIGISTPFHPSRSPLPLCLPTQPGP